MKNPRHFTTSLGLAFGLVCSAACATSAPVAPPAIAPLRSVPAKDAVWPNTVSLDADWLFLPEDPAPAGAPVAAVKAPKTPEAQWEKIALPHTWNAKDTLETRDYRRGLGWYRKHLAITPEFLAKDLRHFVRFGAANAQAQVFLNGRLIGEHVGGYSAFTVELTGLLREGDNVLEVRVDNRPIPTLNPTSDGLFNLYGGLYRSVEFLHAPRIGFARAKQGGPGVRVWSQNVSADSADLHVEALMDDASESQSPRDYTVQAQLADADGQVVSQISVPARAALHLTLPPVAHPQLWSPEHPTLYTLTLRLMKDGAEADRVSVHHGFRFFRFTADHGFFLNGAPYKLHGVNRHQDFKGMGNALHPEQHAKDLRLMKELGVNWLRLAHYQQDDYVLQLCDQLGILVWEEIPFVRGNSALPEYEQSTQSMLHDMIAQHFNHPAIILWGMGNEIYYGKGADGRASQFGLISRLNDTIHQEDPVRKSVIVNGDANNASNLKIMGIPDVIGYNVYKGWYGGRIEELTARLEQLHHMNPDKPMFLSEFGAGAKFGKHSDHPKAWDMSEEYQAYFLKEHLRQLDANPWICGYNWWNFADFGWAASSNPKLFNNKGLVSFDRQPKASFYLLREHLTGVKAPKAQTAPKTGGDNGKEALPTGEDANPFKADGK